MQSLPISRCRFIACSATIGNAQDIADWLGAPPQGLKEFGDETRPCPLVTKVLGYHSAKNDFLFEKYLKDYVFNVVVQHYGCRPALVFCASRNSVRDSALKVTQEAQHPRNSRHPFVFTPEQASRLREAASMTGTRDLQQCLREGVGMHHAGLSNTDRALVERLFLKRDLTVLCTTSTLAVGVNLPAHLVVIRGTRVYDNGSYRELDKSSVLQMAGRAGRPQFDTEGRCVIMTQRSTVNLYDKLVNGRNPVESTLQGMLAECLNAEIALRTLTDVASACSWLRSTYLHVRMRRDPAQYGLPAHANSAQLESEIRKLVMKSMDELVQFGLCSVDRDGLGLHGEVPGRLMMRYYIRFETMKLIQDAPRRQSAADLLMIITQSQELSNVHLRQAEKKQIKQLNAEAAERTPGRIRYPVLEKNGKPAKVIRGGSQKLFLLVQEVMADIPSAHPIDSGMRQEVEEAFTSGKRIARCMAELYQHKQELAACANALKLAKCLELRMWEDSKQICRQFQGIGRIIAASLSDAGLHTLDEILNEDPRRIERFAKRSFPWGDNLKSRIRALPRVLIEVSATKVRSNVSVEFEVRLKLREPDDGISRSGIGDSGHWATLLAGSRTEDTLVLAQHICIEKLPSPYVVHFVVPISPDGSVQMVAALIAERTVGRDTVIVSELKAQDVQNLRARGSSATAPEPHIATAAAPCAATAAPRIATGVLSAGASAAATAAMPNTAQPAAPAVREPLWLTAGAGMVHLLSSDDDDDNDTRPSQPARGPPADAKKPARLPPPPPTQQQPQQRQRRARPVPIRLDLSSSSADDDPVPKRARPRRTVRAPDEDDDDEERPQRPQRPQRQRRLFESSDESSDADKRSTLTATADADYPRARAPPPPPPPPAVEAPVPTPAHVLWASQDTDTGALAGHGASAGVFAVSPRPPPTPAGDNDGGQAQPPPPPASCEALIASLF